MKRRLFVAVALDDTTREACAGVARRLRAKGWPGRWIAPENYHLTVAFLGGVEDDRVGAASAAVRDVVGSVSPFDVRLDAVGAFPNDERPRVAWTGPLHGANAFGSLCGAVRSSLAAHGFTFDERSDAHVTLARADGKAPLPRVAPARDVTVRVDALTLYESFTRASGASYVALERHQLGAR